MTTIYYAQIFLRNKWCYVAMSGFFLFENSALDCARIASNGKNYRTISVQVNLDADGNIID